MGYHTGRRKMNIPEEFKELYDKVIQQRQVDLSKEEVDKVVDFTFTLSDEDLILFLKSIYPSTMSMRIIPTNDNPKVDEMCGRFVQVMKELRPEEYKKAMK